MEIDHARRQARNFYPYRGGEAPMPLTIWSRSREITILLRNSEKLRGGKYTAAEFDMDRAFDNVLNPTALAFLKAAEDEFTESEDYRRFCYNNFESNKDCDGKPRKCSIPVSITTHPLLYGEYDNSGNLCNVRKGSKELSDKQFDEFMRSLVIDDKLDPLYSRFLGKDFNSSTRVTQIIRSFCTDRISNTRCSRLY